MIDAHEPGMDVAAGLPIGSDHTQKRPIGPRAQTVRRPAPSTPFAPGEQASPTTEMDAVEAAGEAAETEFVEATHSTPRVAKATENACNRRVGRP